MSGYCSIGATDIDTAPASTIKSEMTDERIGRSMKKWVNTRLLLRRLAVLRRLAGGCFRLGGAGLADLDRLARDDFQGAVDHHAVAGPQTLRDQDALLARVVAHHDGPELGCAVLLDHVHQMPVGPLLHRELRHDDRIGSRATLDVGRDEHAGTQLSLRVRYHRAHLERAGLLAESRIGEIDLAALGIRLAVGQDDLHLVVLVL